MSRSVEFFVSRLLSVVILSALLSGCGLQSIPQSKTQVEASLADVTNQYKRRADLIPNLVSTVKGYAQHEEKTLTEVIEARAKATSINLSIEKLDPAQIQQYQNAQNSMSQALGRLLAVSEQYPQLKADQNFRDLQAQLEGTENRIAVARSRYIESIQSFNNLISVPPTSWTNSLFYHHAKLPQWTADASEHVEKAPEVKF